MSHHPAGRAGTQHGPSSEFSWFAHRLRGHHHGMVEARRSGSSLTRTPPSDGSHGEGGGEGVKAARKPVRALSAFRDRVRARPGGALGWRIGVTVIGVAIVVGGIILLPLPGPGWLIIFAGLGVLATEYEWAARLLRFAREQVSRWTSWIGRQPLWVRAVLGVLTTLLIVAVAIVAWKIYN